MDVYDKAKWQIEGGIPEENVLNHFKFFLKWLNDHNLLSEDGKEIEEIGLDNSISLTDTMVTSKGKCFLDRYYDDYLKVIDYGISEDVQWLDDHLDNDKI